MHAHAHIRIQKPETFLLAFISPGKYNYSMQIVLTLYFVSRCRERQYYIIGSHINVNITSEQYYEIQRPYIHFVRSSG